jgi:hypothetical protein
MMYYLTSHHRLVSSKTALKVGEKLLLQCGEGDDEWVEYDGKDAAKTENKKMMSQQLTSGDKPNTMFDVGGR